MAEELDWSGLFEEMKELGIKPEAPKQSNVITQDTRLRMSFEEIVKKLNHIYLEHPCFYELDKHIVIVFHATEEKDGDNTRLRIKVEGEQTCQLCAVGGLTCTLQTHKHDDSGTVGIDRNMFGIAAHELAQLFVDDLDDNILA